MLDPMEPTCTATTLLANRPFVCVAPAHPGAPDNHMFVREDRA